MNTQDAPLDPTTSAAVQVVGGLPNDIEVAALVAGLAAVASGTEEVLEEPLAPSQWQNRARRLNAQPLARGSDQWRWSDHF